MKYRLETNQLLFTHSLIHLEILGSILEILLIFIENLHTPSLRNYILLVQAGIFLTVGDLIVNSFLCWLIQVIGYVLTIVAVVLITVFVLRINKLKRKIRITLFIFFCIFILLGIIFISLSSMTPGFKIGFGICCICTMLIAAVTITYNLRKLSASTTYYLLFISTSIWFEFILLYFSICYLEVSAKNAIFGNNTTICDINMTISL
ncbi:hypothetical protein MN116_007588 [Schistosoma mekongi]|uniref:Uncharacterized protein n=1 Tax=Schistosoma mekongi TaxID=38744 RepID=A0AAE1Z8T2_SCHME|nr:hypothetical protein MN116_007588 [Schistosoma mekongi]